MEGELKDWYTVPAVYGGRTFPLYRRLFLEWLWRRHGRAGLDWYLRRLGRRVSRSLEKLEAATLFSEARFVEAAIAWSEFTEMMRRATGPDSGDGSESPARAR